MWSVGMIALELLNSVDIYAKITGNASIAAPQHQGELRRLKQDAKKKDSNLWKSIEGLFETNPANRTTARNLVQPLVSLGLGARSVTADFAELNDAFVNMVLELPVPKTLMEAVHGISTVKGLANGTREALAKAQDWVVHRGADFSGLTVDEMAAIYLYTLEHPKLYELLNAKLRSGNMRSSKPFLPYARLLTSALHKLPDVKSTTAYRGINADLPLYYQQEGFLHAAIQQF